MKLIVLSALSAAVSPALASVVARQSNTQKGNLPPVEVRGNAFFAGDERFYVRGVAYQPGSSLWQHVVKAESLISDRWCC